MQVQICHSQLAQNRGSQILLSASVVRVGGTGQERRDLARFAEAVLQLAAEKGQDVFVNVSNRYQVQYLSHRRLPPSGSILSREGSFFKDVPELPEFDTQVLTGYN